MKYAYPAIFFPDEDCVGVYFYDAENWLTFGRTFKEAIENAQDVLNFALSSAKNDNEKIPAPTPLQNIKLKKNQSVMLIYSDISDLQIDAVSA